MRMNPTANVAEAKLKSDAISLITQLPTLEISDKYEDGHELCRSVADDHNQSLKTKLVMSSGMVLEFHQSDDFSGFILSNKSGRYTLDPINDHLYFEPAGTRNVEIAITDPLVSKQLSALLQEKFLDK